MENFKNTTVISDLQDKDNIESIPKEDDNKKVQYKYKLNTDLLADKDQILVEEEYKDEEHTKLISRTFYNKTEPYQPAYTEIFESNIDINTGFVSKIIKGDITDPIPDDRMVGYRYYPNNQEHHNENYYTIVKNQNFRNTIPNEQEYLISSNCGGKTDSKECNQLIMDLYHNQFIDKQGYEITGNTILTHAFVTSLQKPSDQNQAIILQNQECNTTNEASLTRAFQLEINMFYEDKNKKIVIKPIGFYGHASVCIKDNPELKSKIQLVDSSGYFSSDEKKMKEVFGANYTDNLDEKELSKDNLQINGCCSHFSNCYIKVILENQERYKDYKNIKADFDNGLIHLKICEKMSKIFDKDGQETIKLFSSEEDAIKNKDNYFIFKKQVDSKIIYYGLNKQCYKNNFVDIEKLDKILKFQDNIIIESQKQEFNDSFNNIKEQQISIISINNKLKNIQKVLDFTKQYPDKEIPIKNDQQKAYNGDKKEYIDRLNQQKIELNNLLIEVKNKYDSINNIKNLQFQKEILERKNAYLEEQRTEFNNKKVEYGNNPNSQQQEDLKRYSISSIKERLHISEGQTIKEYYNSNKEKLENIDLQLKDNIRVLLQDDLEYKKIKQNYDYNKQLLNKIDAQELNLSNEEKIKLAQIYFRITDIQFLSKNYQQSDKKTITDTFVTLPNEDQEIILTKSIERAKKDLQNKISDQQNIYKNLKESIIDKTKNEVDIAIDKIYNTYSSLNIQNIKIDELGASRTDILENDHHRKLEQQSKSRKITTKELTQQSHSLTQTIKQYCTTCVEKTKELISSFNKPKTETVEAQQTQTQSETTKQKASIVEQPIKPTQQPQVAQQSVQPVQQKQQVTTQQNLPKPTQQKTSQPSLPQNDTSTTQNQPQTPQQIQQSTKFEDVAKLPEMSNAIAGLRGCFAISSTSNGISNAHSGIPNTHSYLQDSKQHTTGVHSINGI